MICDCRTDKDFDVILHNFVEDTPVGKLRRYVPIIVYKGETKEDAIKRFEDEFRRETQ